MRCNPLPLMEDLDRPCRHPDPELLPEELVGNRIVVLADLDMAVEPDLALDPFGVFAGRGGQRRQRRPVGLLEQLPPAGAEVPGHLAVEPIQQLPDRGVQLGQGK